MPDVKRQVKIITEQATVDRPSGVEGFPLREWSISIVLLNDQGDEIPATIFNKVTYKLHESFGSRQKQTFNQPPFRISEEGWGEFDMEIVLTAIDRGGDHSILHDLNFQSARYEAKHTITFKNPKPGLVAVLRESGPIPGDENKKKADDSKKKKKGGDKGIDMESLAEMMTKLREDDLLHVVQLIHDNKSPDTYTKNDVDAGEFHVDLYTVPDSLLEQLWNFCRETVK